MMTQIKLILLVMTLLELFLYHVPSILSSSLLYHITNLPIRFFVDFSDLYIDDMRLTFPCVFGSLPFNLIACTRPVGYGRVDIHYGMVLDK